MSESIEKQLVSAFSEGWNETAPKLLWQPSELSLLSLREVTGEEMANALIVSTTLSSAFVLSCEGGITGVAVCLFKADDGAQIESIVGSQKEADGMPAIGVRAVINDAFAAASLRLATTVPQHAVSFGEALYRDLAKEESYLPALLGDATWIGTFSLSIGTDLDTQLLFLYAPHASLNAKNRRRKPGGEPTRSCCGCRAGRYGCGRQGSKRSFPAANPETSRRTAS
ncbi:MAG: hypothetical protein WKF84_01800 [Pyrinomonadaceae bacterium]